MTLSALEIGSLELTPTFNAQTVEYTATTTNASDVITATATDETATVVIESDDATIGDDGEATWAEGDNVVTITVTGDTDETVYTVTVTYTPENETIPEG